MTYETKIEKLVGSYVAEFQQELSLAREMRAGLVKRHLPYGYPKGVYHPKARPGHPVFRPFITHSGGRLSNSVPRILSADMVGGYPLGVYYPRS